MLFRSIIERHFTWNKKADGPDHQLSADPAEMKWLVDAVRAFEIMRGSGVKEPATSETTTRRNNRKSIVVLRQMKAGDVIGSGDIAVKRPGYGIAPKYFDEVIGRRVLHDMEQDGVLAWEDLE